MRGLCGRTHVPPKCLAAPNCPTLETPTITVRSDKLEYAITAASISDELVGLFQLLKREVLDV
jgi:hypothetical protein